MHDSPLIWIAAIVAVPFLGIGAIVVSQWLFGDNALLSDDSPTDTDGPSNKPGDPFIF